MVMRMPIPKKIRDELSDDPFMSHCIIDDSTCSGRTEWHHGLRYASKRTNELYSIIPLCHYHHSKAESWRITDEVNKAIIARIKHFHAEEDFRKKYPKSTLLAAQKTNV